MYYRKMKFLLEGIVNFQDKLAKAQNPQTTPEELEGMMYFPPYSYEENDLLKRTIMSNPSAPLEHLVRFAPAYPKEFHENPIIPLLDLEHPNWHHTHLKADAVYPLMDVDPVSWGARFIAHPDAAVRTQAVSHESVKLPELEKFATSNDYALRNGAVINPNASIELLDKLSNDNHPIIAGKAAQHKNATPELLDRMARHTNDYVRTNVAHHSKTPDATLEFLKDDEFSHHVRDAAKNQILWREQQKYKQSVNDLKNKWPNKSKK